MPGFLAHLARHALLQRLPRLDETGEHAVHARWEAPRAGKEDAAIAHDRDDHRRGDAGVAELAAGGAVKGALPLLQSRGRAAGAAEPVREVPLDDLQGAGGHAEEAVRDHAEQRPHALEAPSLRVRRTRGKPPRSCRVRRQGSPGSAAEARRARAPLGPPPGECRIRRRFARPEDRFP